MGGVILICLRRPSGGSHDRHLLDAWAAHQRPGMAWPRRWWLRMATCKSDVSQKWMENSCNANPWACHAKVRGEADILWQGVVMSIADTLTLQCCTGCCRGSQFTADMCRLQMFIKSFVYNYNYRKGQGWGEGDGQPLMVVSDKWIKMLEPPIPRFNHYLSPCHKHNPHLLRRTQAKYSGTFSLFAIKTRD